MYSLSTSEPRGANGGNGGEGMDEVDEAVTACASSNDTAAADASHRRRRISTYMYYKR